MHPDPGPLDDEAAHLAAAHGRDELHALLLARTIQLAARTHPEVVREAIASVFNLKEYEANARRVASDMDRIRRDTQTARDMVRDECIAMQKELERLRAECDGLRYELECERRKCRHRVREEARKT
jgi:hypothetical protein